MYMIAEYEIGAGKKVSSENQFAGFKRPENKKSRGIGDTIAKMTAAVGIKPCGGCKKRQEYLNKKMPYKN